MNNSPSNLVSSHTVSSGDSILTALKKINALEEGQTLALFITDSQQRLLGSLTDGDIRRRLLITSNVQEEVIAAMNKSPKFLERNKLSLQQIVTLRDSHLIKLLPILNDKQQIVDILDLGNNRSCVPVHAVLMAGGEGQRLRPLTANCPKPMLTIGGKPIIHHTVTRLSDFGVKRITICIRYLAEQIRSYFSETTIPGVEIDFVEEPTPLGTLGGACSLAFGHSHVLVMNADIVSTIDFEDLFLFHERNHSVATVAAFPRVISIPFAVLQTDGPNVLSLREKPDYEFWCNSGIYLFNSECFSNGRLRPPLHATDAIDILKSEGARVSMYPLYAYWKDLGTVTDLEQARSDFPFIRF